MALQKILVWDAPVRVFHALLAVSFAGAWLTAEADGWRLAHVTLGYTVAALVAWRILWGVIGTRHARFTDFVRGLAGIRSYLGQLLEGKAPHGVGHNPLGAVAIVLLLTLGVLAPLSGWGTLNHLGGEALEEMHETLGSAMLLIVTGHLLGVGVGIWMHGRQLATSMVTGYKRGESSQAIPRARWVIGVLLIAGVLGFWLLQWKTAAQGGLLQPAQVLAAERGEQQDGKEDDD